MSDRSVVIQQALSFLQSQLAIETILQYSHWNLIVDVHEQCRITLDEEVSIQLHNWYVRFKGRLDPFDTKTSDQTNLITDDENESRCVNEKIGKFSESFNMDVSSLILKTVPPGGAIFYLNSLFYVSDGRGQSGDISGFIDDNSTNKTIINGKMTFDYALIRTMPNLRDQYMIIYWKITS